MEELDIRWHQRFKNYSDAVDRLNEASELLCQKDIAPRERTLMSEGLIQRFEFTQELAWKVIIKKIQLLYARLFTEFKITMQTKL